MLSRKGDFMTTSKNVEKYLWILSVIFITYLLLGSFIVSKDFLDLAYLITLYSFMGVVKIINIKK